MKNMLVRFSLPTWWGKLDTYPRETRFASFGNKMARIERSWKYLDWLDVLTRRRNREELSRNRQNIRNDFLFPWQPRFASCNLHFRLKLRFSDHQTISRSDSRVTGSNSTFLPSKFLSRSISKFERETKLSTAIYIYPCLWNSIIFAQISIIYLYRNIVRADIKKEEKRINNDFHSHLRLDFLDELRFFRGQFLLLLLKKNERTIIIPVINTVQCSRRISLTIKPDITRNDQSDDRVQDQDFRGEISRKFMGYRINDHTLYDSIWYDYISID